MIVVDSVSKAFGKRQVLTSVSCEVRRSELLAIIGPSGSGKTTLLRCMNHLETIDHGAIRFGSTLIEAKRKLDEHVAAALRRDVGMVFQQLNLWPYRSGLENIIEGGVYSRGLSRGQAIDDAERWARRLGIVEELKKYPSQMSGGQRQRVAIARAVVMRPQFLLLDEITAALDPVLAGEVSDILVELKSAGLGIAVVTHQIDFARRNANKVLFMRDGSVCEAGSTEILSVPSTVELSTFLKSVRHGW